MKKALSIVGTVLCVVFFGYCEEDLINPAE